MRTIRAKTFKYCLQGHKIVGVSTVGLNTVEYCKRGNKTTRVSVVKVKIIEYYLEEPFQFGLIVKAAGLLNLGSSKSSRF